MNGEDREILQELGPWLSRRSRGLANRLRRAEDAADIEHEVLVIFYENAEKWLQQKVKLNRTAQLRTLLGFCLNRVAQDHYTRIAREQLGYNPLRESEGEDPEDPDVAPSRWAGSEAEAVDAIDTRRRFDELYAAILEKLPPPRGLFLLAIHAPQLLELGQVQKASTFRAGGANPVRRPVDEAWALFRRQREDAELVNDPPRWKREVAEIFQLPGPLGSHREVELKRAVNYIDQQISRARSQLFDEMAQGQEP